MGGGKKSKAPRAPDYEGAARAQGAADLQTAQYTTGMDRPNQYGPTGSVTWSRTGASQGQLDALHNQAQGIRAQLQANPWDQGLRNQLTAIEQQFGAVRDASGPGSWEQRVSLTPEEQAIFNQEQQNRLGMEGLAGTAIGRAGQTIGTQFNPNLTGFRDPRGYEQAGWYPLETMGDMQRIDESTGRFQQQGDEVRDAMYKQMTRFSDERFGEEENRERSRLQQLGLQEGTAAYQNALQEFRRSKDESYQGAQLASILAGGQEQSRLTADQLATRQSNIGLQQGKFDQGSQIFGMNQRERQMTAANQLDLANYYAQQRQQQFGEQSYMRSLPINEISALLGGGGVSMPQMPGFNAATQFNSPDLLGATQAGYNAKMGQYNAGQQQKGGLLGAGAGLLGGFLGGK